jgi:hypothetical protein
VSGPKDFARFCTEEHASRVESKAFHWIREQGAKLKHAPKPDEVQFVLVAWGPKPEEGVAMVSNLSIEEHGDHIGDVLLVASMVLGAREPT